MPADDTLPALSFLPSWSLQERVKAELEVLGLNVSAHPLAFVREDIRHLGAVPFARLRDVPDGRRVLIAGVLERAQMPWIRSGHRTMFLTLEDETDLAEVVCFSDVIQRHAKLLKETVYLLVEGELQNNDERGLAIVAHRIFDLMAVLRDPEKLKERLAPLRRPAAPFAPGPARPAPEDHRWPTTHPAEALRELPHVEPRTRPGRTG